MAGNNVPGLERCLLHAPGVLLGFCRDKNSWMSETLHCSCSSREQWQNTKLILVPIPPQPSGSQFRAHRASGANRRCHGGEKGRKKKRGEPAMPCPHVGFPQHSSPGISYCSARHLRREVRNKPCSSGYPSIDYIFSMAYFPFLFFPTRCLTQYILINAKKGKIHALQH